MPEALPDKLSAEWGERTARSLYHEFLGRFDVPWQGADVLDVGCSWGYLLRFLRAEVGIDRAEGVDIDDAWSRLSPEVAMAVEDISFHHGDPRSVEALRDSVFDVIVSSGTLFLLAPTEQLELMRWIYDHLRPGGTCVIATRTFLSYVGGDLHRDLRTPVPHLLFPSRVLREYLADRGRELRYTNPSCGATYLMLYHRTGFEVVDAYRAENPRPGPPLALTAGKLSAFDATELGTTELHAHLRRPLETDLSDLRVVS